MKINYTTDTLSESKFFENNTNTTQLTRPSTANQTKQSKSTHSRPSTANQNYTTSLSTVNYNHSRPNTAKTHSHTHASRHDHHDADGAKDDKENIYYINNIDMMDSNPVLRSVGGDYEYGMNVDKQLMAESKVINSLEDIPNRS